MLKRHDSRLRSFGIVAAAFVIEEEEQPVLSTAEKRSAVLAKVWERERPAQAAAELMTLKRRPRRTVPIVEECIRRERFAAVIFAQRPVERVCPGTRRELDLAAARAAFGSVGIG